MYGEIYGSTFWCLEVLALVPWLCGSVALWLCGSVALWLYGQCSWEERETMRVRSFVVCRVKARQGGGEATMMELVELAEVLGWIRWDIVAVAG